MDENSPLAFSQWKHVHYSSQESSQRGDTGLSLPWKESQPLRDSTNHNFDGYGLSESSQQMLNQVQLFPKQKSKVMNKPRSGAKSKVQQMSKKSRTVRVIRQKHESYASLRRLLLLSRLTDPATRTRAVVASMYSTEDFKLLLDMRKNVSESTNNGQLAEMLLECIHEKTVRIPRKPETDSAVTLEEFPRCKRAETPESTNATTTQSIEWGTLLENKIPTGKSDERGHNTPSREKTSTSDAKQARVLGQSTHVCEIEENVDEESDSQKTVALDISDTIGIDATVTASSSPAFDKYFAPR
eukprot:gb/GECG01006715.1/.p1 GENE.gb/GECG01006715.1/~~gb/GECG01006715.1/.p1  ORF type:complete len:299 (+),score=44.05 gb/GECG01006715.1/:1-897(+)